jgi:large subunit ribosomal protein L15
MPGKKRNRRSRIRGRKTCGWGARKRHRGSGHRGGKGKAGSGKRADHKKNYYINGQPYFGKRGLTSKTTEKKYNPVINLGFIEKNMESFIKKGISKESKEGISLNLKEYKILGDGEITRKLKIYAKEASGSAVEKIEKAGGKIILKEEKQEREIKK